MILPIQAETLTGPVTELIKLSPELGLVGILFLGMLLSNMWSKKQSLALEQMRMDRERQREDRMENRHAEYFAQQRELSTASTQAIQANTAVLKHVVEDLREFRDSNREARRRA